MSRDTLIRARDLSKTYRPARMNKVVVIVAGVLLLSVLAFVSWRFGVVPGGSLDDHTILVLPMEVRGQEEGADYFGRVFAEAIVVNLAVADGLRVLPVPAGGNDTGDHRIGH